MKQYNFEICRTLLIHRFEYNICGGMSFFT